VSVPTDTSPPVFTLKTRAAKPPEPYVHAIGPRLRILLYMVFAGFSFLGATGIYLLMISAMNRINTDQLYTTPFTFWMLVAHTGIGVIGVAPYAIFGIVHLYTAWGRKNRVAVRLGLLVFFLGVVTIVSGLALIQIEGMPQLPSGSISRISIYLAHLIVPVAAVFAYIAHRRAGPAIKWKYGRYWGIVVLLVVGGMATYHMVDPQIFAKVGSPEGMQYFFPSEARTTDGKFIPERALMMDEYCAKCHQDVFNDHLHSAHKFSSFNNPAYLFSIKETRKVSLERDGKMNASRWCAGCHDQVPFLSGKFDDPNYDIVKDPTAHAGITCVICHSITHINSPIGNAAFTIEEAKHYPFAFSENASLQWLNNQLIKAKPELHKKTFLKPLHKSAEFCSVCHKVHLPVELNHYKDFLRGQNHYDSYILSGLGNGSRSFYFPPTGRKENCAECHMPLEPSNDFGSKDFDGTGTRKRHLHFFPAANTGLFELLKYEDRYKDRTPQLQKSIDTNAAFLRGTAPDGSDRKLRIDLFGVKKYKEGAPEKEDAPDDESLVAIRPALPKLQPGKNYLLEVVIRTLNIGHQFSQGTVDSNEIWVDFEAKAGDKVIGRSGGLSGPDDTGEVDPWSHFVNVYMLDRKGNRIDRRNPQDIYTPLYDKQIPPGAGQVVHYKLAVPKDVSGPVTITVKLRYRKFDFKYMEYVHKESGKPIPKLPIVDICTDRVTLPVAGVAENVAEQESPIKPAWQRWNDYGIGCFIEGGLGLKRGNLKQAEVAFKKLLTLGAKDALSHGHLNLARVYNDLGQFPEAREELEASINCDPPAPWWVVSWFMALVKAQDTTSREGLDWAIDTLEKIVDPATQPRRENGSLKFDFTRDYVVLAQLGRTLFNRAQLEQQGSEIKRQFLLRSIAAYERAQAIDLEDVDTHYGLQQCYFLLGQGIEKVPPTSQSVTTDYLKELAASVVKKENPNGQRIKDAAELIVALETLENRTPDPHAPILPTIRLLISLLQPAFHEEHEITLKGAIAAALAALHGISHEVYRQDDNARSIGAIHRRNNPAANAAAEAIVIYPTNRPGAPGLMGR
jgi:tetratricopeptide (TPR) repeat protein